MRSLFNSYCVEKTYNSKIKTNIHFSLQVDRPTYRLNSHIVQKPMHVLCVWRYLNSHMHDWPHVMVLFSIVFIYIFYSNGYNMESTFNQFFSFCLILIHTCRCAYFVYGYKMKVCIQMLYMYFNIWTFDHRMVFLRPCKKFFVKYRFKS